jgi:hypothetical protein
MSVKSQPQPRRRSTLSSASSMSKQSSDFVYECKAAYLVVVNDVDDCLKNEKDLFLGIANLLLNLYAQPIQITTQMYPKYCFLFIHVHWWLYFAFLCLALQNAGRNPSKRMILKYWTADTGLVYILWRTFLVIAFFSCR